MHAVVSTSNASLLVSVVQTASTVLDAPVDPHTLSLLRAPAAQPFAPSVSAFRSESAAADWSVDRCADPTLSAADLGQPAVVCAFADLQVLAVSSAWAAPKQSVYQCTVAVLSAFAVPNAVLSSFAVPKVLVVLYVPATLNVLLDRQVLVVPNACSPSRSSAVLRLPLNMFFAFCHYAKCRQCLLKKDIKDVQLTFSLQSIQ